MGMKALHAGAGADAVRAARIDAAERVVAVARDHGSEFILVAGDTFEDNAVDRSLVAKVAEILASARQPVFVISGNHDPLVPGSVWSDHCWNSTPSVTILREEKPVQINTMVTLWPGIALRKHDERDPTAWMRVHDRDKINIVVAHGTVEAVHREEPWYPVARDAPERIGADYVALGHFHGYTPYAAKDGATRMAYCGTHEPTRFAERSVGSVVMVELAGPGAAPTLTVHQTGELQWISRECTLSASGEVGRLHDEIKTLPLAEKTLLRLRLHGYFHLDEQDALLALADEVRGRFLDGRVESFLRPAPADARWMALLPQGPAKLAAERLARWSEQECADRPEGVTAMVASRALFELYALASADGDNEERPVRSRPERARAGKGTGG
jgi:DNA repair exonuclease SbcCD nuclease subunit